MKRFERFILSQFIWIATITLLFVNLDSIRLAENSIFIIGIAMSLAILINLGIWFGEGIARAFDDDIYENLSTDNSKTELAESDLEKRKRERIDSVLRDLSNEDLVILQQRLQDGNIDDDLLYEHIVGDDGELIRRS